MSDRSVKVLEVIDTLGMGGAETWLMEVVRLWSKTGACQMDFLATSGNKGLFDEEAVRLGARVHYVPYTRTQLPNFVREFRALLDEEKYDAIHDHQDYASGWHFLMGRGLLPPVRVTHVHNSSYQILNNYGVTPSRRLAGELGKRLVARYATHITGTSRQVVGEYGFDAPRFSHIPKAALHCGFEPKRFAGDAKAARSSLRSEFGWPEDAKVILFVGRLDQSPDSGHSQNGKNSGFALAVGIDCALKDGQVRMLFAGASSPALAVLERRVTAAGLDGRIRFGGVRKDVERLMVASDVLLFPSRGEGLGMVAVEAQAAGLPVLASSAVPRECTVVPELVQFQDEKAGSEAWANELLAFMARPHDRIAANRRVATSAFAIDKSADALIRLYSRGVLA